MKRIAIVVFAVILLALPIRAEAQQNRNISAANDFGGREVAPHLVLRISKPEYNAWVQFVINNGHQGSTINVGEFEFKDSAGYEHDVIVTSRPEDVFWKDGRPMQIDVYVSGAEHFAYAVGEAGLIQYNCTCRESTPSDARNKYDSIIIAAVRQMIAKSKKK